MLRTFIQITALLVTLIASFFWIRGSLTVSVKDIAALAGTYFDYNLTTLKNLCAQKADSLIAALLLILSFVLQFFNAAWPMRWDDFAINKKGIVYAVIFSSFVFLICYVGASFMSKHFCSKAQTLLQEKK